MNQEQIIFETLPALPIHLTHTQCITFGTKEILICGGNNINNCYSYHIEKKEYRLICSYPKTIKLWGHTVVDYSYYYHHYPHPDFLYNYQKQIQNLYITNNNNNNNNNKSITLLSFGMGDDLTSSNIHYHTMLMHYKSVWDLPPSPPSPPPPPAPPSSSSSSFSFSSAFSTSLLALSSSRVQKSTTTKEITTKEITTKETATIKATPYNQWITVKDSWKFGEKQQHDLWGARALISGTKHHLLFITRRTCSIDVIDLLSFQYLSIKNKNNPILPTSKNNEVHFHCFVLIQCNQFILISQHETVFIHYHEDEHEFSYQLLSFGFPLQKCNDYSYILWNSRIIIFGGFNWKTLTYNETIHIYHIKENKWFLCPIKMPLALSGTFAIICESDLSVHILGGKHQYGKQLTHFSISLEKLLRWTPNEINIMMEYWMRMVKQQYFGWIKEFNDIIANYL